MPGRQRLRGGGRRGRDGAHLPRDAAQLDLGRRRQHHGAGPAARAAQGAMRLGRALAARTRAGARRAPGAATAWPPRCPRASTAMADRDRGAPPGAGRGAGRAGRAAAPDTRRTAVFERLLRFAPGRRLGPGLRHAAAPAPTSTRSSRAPCRAEPSKRHPCIRPDPAPLRQLAVLREDPPRSSATRSWPGSRCTCPAMHAQARRGGAHRRLPHARRSCRSAPTSIATPR